ncbi:hypothetical protein AAG570_014173 [Ranatra chinensis]|uniref:ABC transporter domain-containing protein n=1 Tax=Ranatra chinensis TaxID=642074 RepID=A0ABD0XSB5_9HEMI
MENVMGILKISGLTKRYKKFTAVQDVTFEVPEGAVYGLVGLNGAGKTTTIKSITGLLKKFDGDISIAGLPWGHKDYNKEFSFLPELFTPPLYLTGMEYVKFILELHKAKVDMDLVNRMCDTLNFDKNLLDKKTKTYSKGTMQKIGLIQAVCTPAKLLILDEPMSGLDPLARARFKNLIADVNQKGTTLFLSTHILHDIDTLCSHIGILNAGRLLFNGTPAELKQKYNVTNLEDAFLKEIGA